MQFLKLILMPALYMLVSVPVSGFDNLILGETIKQYSLSDYP